MFPSQTVYAKTNESLRKKVRKQNWERDGKRKREWEPEKVRKRKREGGERRSERDGKTSISPSLSLSVRVREESLKPEKERNIRGEGDKGMERERARKFLERVSATENRREWD